MTVAVIVPCFRERLERVERTIRSALDVPSVDVVIVVDDGANDTALDSFATKDLVAVVRLPENLGCSAALNAGIELLSDDAIICRLDVGDVFFPEAKERQLEVVLSGKARCSSSPHFDPVANKVWVPPHDWKKAIYRDSVFTGCTNVYRKDVWARVGGHDESLRYLGDWDFSMKVQDAVGWHMHDEPTCEAGMYPDGFSARAQLDPITKKRRVDDRSLVAERGRAITHPDAFAHLRNPKWRRKRGLA